MHHKIISHHEFHKTIYDRIVWYIFLRKGTPEERMMLHMVAVEMEQEGLV